MFLEMWKRYSAEITHRWDLTGFDAQEESPRPQYLARLALLDKANLAKYKLNVITNSIEPRVPFWKIRFPATILSFSIVLLLVSVFLISLFANIFHFFQYVRGNSKFIEMLNMKLKNRNISYCSLSFYYNLKKKIIL